ncbi:MAG: 16S rRNA (cytosine(1402)-N(4))-methyltransferase RsmH [Bdellovibrionales bacterium]|jgi:16S rRNA (cytosine1402-N4)-methyltransferase|nr:16S rRNA (cytosine(1402)-N(4))-methyltransferase RsmH [Bdellovibrionales bacterium]MBT3526041.1 16S rRNA (cytosine(1402)-N(4))-methyltransferase RsmH [Bdellovibrionales bacterium]MBT7668697.1 16S rRNA (cytosine(1402)-N(4))-methyltransferase RsmH [Bdellovibrionales bacterium]MBT7765821.1 16S rRNA (cytosine(1402)-N(4))-methyltransferase RsmH [Bdellovibrionales bacterium]
MSLRPEYSIHYSVLKQESLQYLTNDGQNRDGWFLDLTFGGGGHSTAFLDGSQTCNVIAIDQDPEAIANGQKTVERYTPRLQLLDMNFSEFSTYYTSTLAPLEIAPQGFQGILMDLGVSSHQFDSGERGFSFRYDSDLDMRMDCDNTEIPTAQELINTLAEEELISIFQQYGEERYARRIAQQIVEERSRTPITTTKQLENIAFHAYPKRFRHGKTHPATRIFQALRIVVNGELEHLKLVIPTLLPLLGPGGRLAIISFHSLEDRIVKRAFKELAPKGSAYTILTKKPQIPTEEEIKENSRSRSAKLRVLERREGVSNGA